MKKFLATLLLLAVGFTLCACDNGDESGNTNGGGANGVSFTATVSDLNFNSNRFLATVNGGEASYSQYLVKLAGNTLYYHNGKGVDKKHLANGATVKITYNGISTRSLPPQITAIEIEILSLPTASAGTEVTPESRSSGLGEAISMTARVCSVSSSITVSVTDSAYAAGTYVIHVAPYTAMTDLQGNEISLSDIKAGDILYIEYGDAVTLSLPPQTTAIRIVKH